MKYHYQPPSLPPLLDKALNCSTADLVAELLRSNREALIKTGAQRTEHHNFVCGLLFDASIALERYDTHTALASLTMALQYGPSDEDDPFEALLAAAAHRLLSRASSRRATLNPT